MTKVKSRKPKDAQDVANICYKGLHIQCTRFEYHSFVKPAISKFIKMAIDRKASKKALHAISEISRLDGIHGKELTSEDYEFVAKQKHMEYPDG